MSLTSSLSSRRVPLLSLQTVVGDVVRTLKVMYGSLNRSVSRHSLPLLSRILGRDLSRFFFFDILNVSSAARSVRRTTPSGWTISSACSSSSSSSRGACGKAPRRRLTFLGAFFWTDCRRSDGSLCLLKLRFVWLLLTPRVRLWRAACVHVFN